MSNAPAKRETCDFLIVGAGVIGVTVARELRRRYKGRVLVIEKESLPAQHASGRNSGVLHSGVYYQAKSLKARLCVEGNRRLREYCGARKIAMNDHGKVIVAREARDLPMLDELEKRASANGVEAKMIDTSVLRTIEPCAKTYERALFVRDTAVVNPRAVMTALVEDSQSEGVSFQYDCAWGRLKTDGIAETTQGPISYGHLVNCAGLFADRVAQPFGIGQEYRILPFRGKFFSLRPQSRVKVNANIYPVPDLRYPFLGVHFTRRPTGEVIIGPTALPLLGREQYHGMKGANPSDVFGMTQFFMKLLKKNPDHIRSVAWGEMIRATRPGFYREAIKLVEGLQKDDLIDEGGAGIRAQLVNVRTGDLVMDFVVESGTRSTHVLNAVSPAFTCSLPFAEYVVDNMKVGE